MKKLYSLLLTIVIISSVFSQSPEKMSYQAVIRNSSNNLVSSVLIGMKISILQGTAEGTVVYEETQTTTSNANGLISIEVGTGTTSDDFSAIDWTGGPYFLKTETDPNGGANYTIIGTSQLLSVPYALYSETAGNVFSGSFNDLTARPTTLSGYGISDGMNTSHAANGITSSLIDNWSAAFGWGDHAGLYRPIEYVPAWSEITGRPTFATVATSGSYTDLINTPTTPGSLWTTSGSDIYYNDGNVGIGTNDPLTYIHAHGSPVDARGQLSLSAPSGEGTFLSFYDADIFKAYLWYDVSDEDLRLQNYTAGDLNLNPYGGSVGIGTNDPEFLLTIDNDGGIIAKGTFDSGQTLVASGAGTRLIWYPRKAAFRVGTVEGSEWDDANIGIHSMAMGMRTTASGQNSTAMGFLSDASGLHSTAMGFNTTASGLSSTAMGRENRAIGFNSTAIGNFTEASGHLSTSMGRSTTASGDYSTAMGYYTIASGDYSTAMGYYTNADSYACLALGRWNLAASNYVDSWSSFDPLFIIGNGTSDSERHDALMVRKDGAVFLPDVYDDGLMFLPSRDLYILSNGQIGYLASSLRYKVNISSMEDVSWLYQLRPVNFVYKSDNSQTKQYGLIAEEVEDVIPSFVSYNDDGEVETVSYSQLVTPMLKALQEQQQLIEELRARIDVLENK